MRANITLYAKWTAQSNIAYKVEHYQQSVTGTTYTLTVTDNLVGTTGETVSVTPRTYTGFTENTTHPDRVPSGTVLADGSLVLKFYYDRNTHTVSFNSNGGSAVSPITGVRYGATIGVPIPPTRTGYDFDGWYKEAAHTNPWNFSTDTITADITLYAKWDPKSYTVTFNSNGGGTPNPYSKSVKFGEAYGELATVNRTGHTFSGWFTTQAGGQRKYNTSIVNIAGNHTLYAHWSGNTINVIFNPNGGRVTPSTKQITVGGTYGTLPIPTRSGYNFDGWFTALTGGTEVTNTTNVTNTSNHSIYARWTAA